jgi:hypothetical protein
VAVFTVPILVAFFADRFMGLDAPAVNVTALGAVDVPHHLRAGRPRPADAALRGAASRYRSTLCGEARAGLFVIVVLGALRSQLALLRREPRPLGPVWSSSTSHAAGHRPRPGPPVQRSRRPKATAIAIETGIQNATLGITVGSLIVEQARRCRRSACRRASTASPCIWCRSRSCCGCGALDVIQGICYRLHMLRKASLIRFDKLLLSSGHILQIRIWRLPEQTAERPHGLKYSLFFGLPGERIVGYDNEAGKGDHQHLRDVETSYAFVSMEKLVQDFMSDVDRELSDDRT